MNEPGLTYQQLTSARSGYKHFDANIITTKITSVFYTRSSYYKTQMTKPRCLIRLVINAKQKKICKALLFYFTDF